MCKGGATFRSAEGAAFNSPGRQARENGRNIALGALKARH